YGRSYSVELSPERAEIVFIPPGFAHGFLALENGTLMWYQTSVAHAPEYDRGVAWNSIGFDWPCAHPVISARDAAFPKLSEFVSPF
ncbi:dTDP-4-dehydrorhamnose 3,5-epimerase, partial [bacterium]|nr:dTDP-4-dehydrorhamnose 3,5-epimerase [bacterium]